MAGRPRFSPEEREAILDDVRAGLLTSKEIGERYGLAGNTVDTYARKAGIRRKLGVRAKYPVPAPGSIFGKWKVIGEEAIRPPGRGRLVLCQCQCPGLAEQFVSLYALHTGCSSSCASCAHAHHGLSKHDLYPIWCGIMARCFNPNTQEWPNYGGRGVTIHEDWRDVGNFIAWIEANLGSRPEPERRTTSGQGWWSIDRINPFGNYEPGNLRWATQKTQVANQRKKYQQEPRLTNKCSACGALFAGVRALRKHRKDEHPWGTCELCGRPTRSLKGICHRRGPCRDEHSRRYEAGGSRPRR